MPFAQVNDINVYYEKVGHGEPLLFIPGLGADMSKYKRIILALALHHTVISVDIRGSGRSDKPDAQYSIQMLAQDICELIDFLEIKETNILGFSLGGRIALEMALQHPEKIKRLIIVSTSARTIPYKWRKQLGIISIITNCLRKYPQPHHAFLHQISASSSYNCTERLQFLETPTLILHGKKDKIVPYPLAEEMRSNIDNATLLPFSEGHYFFFYLNEQKHFLGVVEQFISPQRSERFRVSQEQDSKLYESLSHAVRQY